MRFDLILEQVRGHRPLVQCITNFVTVNDCANILLAAGGSPTMSRDIREVEETVTKVQALVCNLGAIDYAGSMVLAGRKANALGIPVVLDPVGAGGTKLRRETVRHLMKEVRFTVIRGNASEIRYLAGQSAKGSGVDVDCLDEVKEENLEEAAALVKGLAAKLGSVIALSGEIDLVSDGARTAVLRNGCATMARITGSGCMLTGLIGAFCGSWADPFEAACAAMGAMGVCGELAEEKRLQKGTGNATFRTDLIDAVFNLAGEQLIQGVDYEIYES